MPCEMDLVIPAQPHLWPTMRTLNAMPKRAALVFVLALELNFSCYKLWTNQYEHSIPSRKGVSWVKLVRSFLRETCTNCWPFDTRKDDHQWNGTMSAKLVDSAMQNTAKGGQTSLDKKWLKWLKVLQTVQRNFLKEQDPSSWIWDFFIPSRDLEYCLEIFH